MNSQSIREQRQAELAQDPYLPTSTPPLSVRRPKSGYRHIGGAITVHKDIPLVLRGIPYSYPLAGSLINIGRLKLWFPMWTLIGWPVYLGALHVQVRIAGARESHKQNARI